MGIFPYRIILLFLLTNSLSLQAQKVSPERISISSPELNTQKTVHILLPKSYTREGKAYPVIYMHDAQNLFDEASSYAGEWGVDETMQDLSLEYIVVAVEHGNEKRIEELTPYTHPKYGGGRGDRYAAFIVNTLKPVIDNRYNTLKQASSTIIAGSSLGGLMSHYMLLTYPETFSGAIILSPSYWYSEKIFELTRSNGNPTGRYIYLATGSLEPESAVKDQERMTGIFHEWGYSNENFRGFIRENAGHNESFWKEEFRKAIEWMSEKTIQAP